MLRIRDRIILGIDIASFKQGYRKNFLIHTFIYKKGVVLLKKDSSYSKFFNLENIWRKFLYFCPDVPPSLPYFHIACWQ